MKRLFIVFMLIFHNVTSATDVSNSSREEDQSNGYSSSSDDSDDDALMVDAESMTPEEHREILNACEQFKGKNTAQDFFSACFGKPKTRQAMLEYFNAVLRNRTSLPQAQTEACQVLSRALRSQIQ
jgi:hypothetical protein